MEAEVWSLCDRSMVALEPWAAAGFRCAAVDIEAPSRPPPPGVEHLQADILDLRGLPGARFVLGWPPCTHLARSGARWWPLKGDAALAEALALVSQVRVLAGDVPLVVENPIGRLSTHWRKPDTIVHPYQFAHHGPDPAADGIALAQSRAYFRQIGAVVEPEQEGGQFEIPKAEGAVIEIDQADRVVIH